MKALRLGVVSYLNTTPMIEGLEAAPEVAMVRAVPSRIAEMLRRGEVDVGLVSFVDVARAGGELTLVPCGMIGCDGPTLTVRLFSAAPLAEVRRVHADTDSHTSVALCRLLLARLHGVRPEVVDFDARERAGAGVGEEGWPETVLLIGDKVVHDSPPAVRYPHQLDLGQAWKQMTDLPFMYACWMCRTAELETAEGRRRVALAAALLDRQVRRNRARLDWVVEQNAETKGWPNDLAREYLGRLLRFTVGPRERAGAELFLRLAGEEGLAPKGFEARWFDERAEVTPAS